MHRHGEVTLSRISASSQFGRMLNNWFSIGIIIQQSQVLHTGRNSLSWLVWGEVLPFESFAFLFGSRDYYQQEHHHQHQRHPLLHFFCHPIRSPTHRLNSRLTTSQPWLWIFILAGLSTLDILICHDFRGSRQIDQAPVLSHRTVSTLKKRGSYSPPK